MICCGCLVGIWVGILLSKLEMKLEFDGCWFEAGYVVFGFRVLKLVVGIIMGLELLKLIPSRFPPYHLPVAESLFFLLFVPVFDGSSDDIGQHNSFFLYVKCQSLNEDKACLVSSLRYPSKVRREHSEICGVEGGSSPC
ncbi:hypothetical protein Droror1_Dr00000257 [Drosera rotundifolia]